MRAKELGSHFEARLQLQMAIANLVEAIRVAKEAIEKAEATMPPEERPIVVQRRQPPRSISEPEIAARS